MNPSKGDLPSPVNTSRDSGELEEWSASEGWELQYLPLKPHTFEACFQDRHLPRTAIQHEHWNSSLQLRGTIRHDIVPMSIPNVGYGIFQGLPFKSGDLIFMKPGSELDLLAQSPIELPILHAPIHVLESVARKVGIENPIALLSGSPVVYSDPWVRQEFTKGMSEMLRVPPEFQSTREELESRMLYLFWEILNNQDARRSGFAGNPPVGIGHVKRAQEFIEENLEGTIRVEDMAAASGVSARALQLCFRDHFQMGPQEYARLRRLHLVNKALQLASPDSHTVTQVAMNHGFYHLGRFSGYYKHMFGESPNATLRLGRLRGFVSVPA